MTDLVAPMPYFGGKSRIAPLIWQRLGDTPNSVEPFLGSAAVLLARPDEHRWWERTETVNDADGLVCNFWRATQAAPEAVAEWASSPVNECVVEGTRIATPQGPRAIEEIMPGDVVWGERSGRVVATMVLGTRRSTAQATSLVSVGCLTITPNHPVWTGSGYTMARHLTAGMTVAMIDTEVTNGDHGSTVCGMRQSVPSKGARWEILLPCLQRNGSPDPREAMRDLRGNVSCPPREPVPSLLFGRLREAVRLEIQPPPHGAVPGGSGSRQGSPRCASAVAGVAALPRKPDLRSGREGQGGGHTSPKGVPDAQWGAGAYCAPAPTCNPAGVANRGHGADWEQERAGRSVVPYRHRRANAANSVGDRRTQPPSGSRSGEGHAQGRFPHRTRGEGPTLPEQAGNGGYGSRDRRNHGGCTVYNLQTESGNYFAAGVLVHNCDLHARHVWLRKCVAELELCDRLSGDPSFYDAQVAGWWVWGMACWIGGGWCHAPGPWWPDADGVLRKRGGGVPRQLPHLGDAGQGVNRQRPHLGNGQGLEADLLAGLVAYFQRLRDRLARVRVCCGDWSRVCGPSPTFKHGLTGVFLDPPYAIDERDPHCYGTDTNPAADVREWCLANGDNPLLRIALCGYAGEGHESLVAAGWDEVAWKAQGGYSSLGNGAGRDNAHRERVWFSPRCLSERGPAQGGLDL